MCPRRLRKKAKLEVVGIDYSNKSELHIILPYKSMLSMQSGSIPLRSRYTGKEKRLPFFLYRIVQCPLESEMQTHPPFLVCWVVWDAAVKKYTVPFISTEDANKGNWNKIAEECKQFKRLHPEVGIVPRGWCSRVLYESANGKHCLDGIMVAEAVMSTGTRNTKWTDTENGRWVLPCEIWNQQWVNGKTACRPFQCTLSTTLTMLKAPMVAWSWKLPVPVPVGTDVDADAIEKEGEEDMEGAEECVQYPIPNCQYVVSSSKAEVDRWLGLGEVPCFSRFCVEEEVHAEVERIMAKAGTGKVWVAVARFAVWREWEAQTTPVLVGFM